MEGWIMSDIRTSALGGIPFGIDSGRPAGAQVGQPYFNGESARLELFTTSVGWQNIVQETPAVVNIVGFARESLPSTVTINGTNFAVGANVFFVGTNGIEIAATSASLVSVVEITAVVPALSPVYEPYDVKVVNPSNLYGVLYESLNVDATPAWTTGSGSLGTYIEQSAMSVQVSATDASDPSSSALVYSITSGSLPGGLTINSSTGVISGTPTNITSTTTYNFTANAFDGQHNVTRNFSITITDRAPTWVTASALPTFTRNVAYSTTLSATNDDAPVSYSLFSGSLPSGLTLNSSTGVISGTPSSSINTTFTIRATESGGNFADRQFTIANVGPSWSSPTTLTNAFKGTAYSYQLSAPDDSASSPVYSLLSGSLVTGLALSSSGLISGTPTAIGASSFTVRATDDAGNIIDRTFSLTSYISVSIDVYGAKGGEWTDDGGTEGGLGGRMSGTALFTSATTLYYLAGSVGPDADGRNAAGGGGFSAVWYGSADPGSGTWLFGAGGGGGENGGNTGSASYAGGAGGINSAYGATAKSGGAGGAGYNGGTGGANGTSSGGGVAGAGTGDNAGGGGGGGFGPAAGAQVNGQYYTGRPGAYGGGGGGGAGGSGGNAYRGDPGGGGGGGYIGGQGGSPGEYASAGGHNYAYDQTLVTVNSSGVNGGNGSVIINGTTYSYTGSIGSVVIS